MKLTKHETTLLNELESTRGSKSKRLVIDMIVIIVGLGGLSLLLFLYYQKSLILLVSALCGGMIGLSIEKMYAQKIFFIALKLYKIKLDEPPK